MSASVKKLLESEEIAVSAIWIDGYEKNRNLDDIPVVNIDDIKRKYKKINVIFGHSRYELADDICKKYRFINKCFCLVDVCYGQWKGISCGFVKEHMEDYLRAYDLMSDQRSKECFTAYLNSKITQDYRYVLHCYDQPVTYFCNPFYTLCPNEGFVDIGAYNGDTIRDFLRVVGDNGYDQIYAIEPEEKSFTELRDFIQKRGWRG